MVSVRQCSFSSVKVEKSVVPGLPMRTEEREGIGVYRVCEVKLPRHTDRPQPKSVSLDRVVKNSVSVGIRVSRNGFWGPRSTQHLKSWKTSNLSFYIIGT